MAITITGAYGFLGSDYLGQFFLAYVPPAVSALPAVVSQYVVEPAVAIHPLADLSQYVVEGTVSIHALTDASQYVLEQNITTHAPTDVTQYVLEVVATFPITVAPRRTRNKTWNSPRA